MMRNRFLEFIGILTGRSKEAHVNTSGVGTTIQSQIYDVQVANNNKYDVNYCLPYGYYSVPVDTNNMLVANVGASGNNVISLGSVEESKTSTIISDLDKGECALKSHGNYALQTLNNKINYLYKGINATACSGEDVQTILIDICQQIEDLYSQLNGIHSALNSHDHVETDSGRTESMSASGTTISPGSPNGVIISDKKFCENGKLLIDENGITPVR